jgi:hypothetical protein
VTVIAELYKALAGHHSALVDLYKEEAQKLDEDFNIE